MELRVVQYVDDTTCIIRDVVSLTEILHIFQEFQDLSGAKLNINKCRGYWLNFSANNSIRYGGIPFNSQGIKCLGVFFSRDAAFMSNENWKKVFNKCQSTVRSLSSRDLTLRGRAVILQSLVCSKIWHVARIIGMPPYWLSKFDSLLFQFVWAKEAEAQDRVARWTTVQPVLSGGLGVPAISLKIKAFNILHIRDLLNRDVTQVWEPFAIYFVGMSLRQWVPSFASNMFPHAGVPPVFYTEVVGQFREFSARLDGDFSPLRELTTKQVYNQLLTKVFTPPLIEVKTNLPGVNFPEVWKNSSDAFVSPDLRNLGWKIVHNVLATNVNCIGNTAHHRTSAFYVQGGWRTYSIVSSTAPYPRLC